MLNFVIDYAQITLEENIPLNNNDLMYMEEIRKSYKVFPIVLAFATLFTMGLVCWFIKDNFKTFTYYDYLLLAGATFGLYFFCYLISWLVTKSDSNNRKKDIQFGKCKLTTVIIYRERGKYGAYFTFAGPLKKDKIRIQVKESDYKQYSIGTNIVVEFLKYSKEALLIVKL